MLKHLMVGFGLISLVMVAGLVVYALAGGGLTAWVLAVVWTVGAVLVLGAMARGAVVQQRSAR